MREGGGVRRGESLGVHVCVGGEGKARSLVCTWGGGGKSASLQPPSTPPSPMTLAVADVHVAATATPT